jgi:hypothetical protein
MLLTDPVGQTSVDGADLIKIERVAMPREDSIREKALRKWAALQEFDLARVLQSKMGCGFFLVEWPSRRIVAGGPEATLEDLEDYLRTIEAPQPPRPKLPAKSRKRNT